jgi:adenylate cyclase
LSTPEDIRPWFFVLVAAVLAVAVSVGGMWEPIERWVYDSSIGLLAARDATRDGYVRVIGIDETSLQSVGPWPWPRTVLAELLERIVEAGAHVVVLDVLLAETSETDTKLLSAMDGSASIVLPYHGVGVATIYPDEIFLPHSIFAHGDVLIDPDGKVRRIPALLARDRVSGLPRITDSSPGEISPCAISIEAVRQFMASQQVAGIEPMTLPIRVQDSSLGIGVIDYPLDGRGNLLFTFPPVGNPALVWPSDKVYSAVDVLNGKIGGPELQNRLVFIGANAIGLPDWHMSSQTHQGPIPGVFFHAAAAWALLTGNVIGVVSPFMLGILAIALLVFQVGYVYRKEPLSGLILTLLALLITSVLYILMVFYRYRWFPIAHLAGTTIVFYVFGLAYRYAQAKNARKQLADSLCRYFSPTVLDEILAMEAGLVTREVEGTVIFADFSGFTALAEKLPPLNTVSVLNHHLAALVEIVFHYGGTLDKFTGDGVMAFFGAPLPNPAHAELAAAAAWDMQEFFEGVDKKEEASFESLNLRLGVGIASGRFVVGNVGAGERFDYTAIGDVVNTAARLEQLAEPGEVLLDANTAESICCQWETKDKGMQVLKGKQSPQRVYRLEGRRERNHDQANEPRAIHCK